MKGQKEEDSSQHSDKMSATTLKDVNKDRIVPNKKAAGIKLGARKATIIKHWGEPIEIEKISANIERLIYGNVNFWIESGKVDQIDDPGDGGHAG